MGNFCACAVGSGRNQIFEKIIAQNNSLSNYVQSFFFLICAARKDNHLCHQSRKSIVIMIQGQLPTNRLIFYIWPDKRLYSKKRKNRREHQNKNITTQLTQQDSARSYTQNPEPSIDQFMTRPKISEARKVVGSPMKILTRI